MIDREFWEHPLTPATRLLCPSCRVGHLRLVPESLKYAEPKASRLAKGEDDWEPVWITYRFVALLKCDNSSCMEPSVVHGTGCVGPDPEDGGYESPFCDKFYPRFVSPSPDLFEIPTMCPQNVAAGIRKAFTLSWGDYDVCANQIRVALELLLTERNVPRYTMKNGRRTLLTLHSRIDKFDNLSSAKNKHLSDLMKAVKWLGNVGSHGADKTKALERGDVFDAFDLLQYVVDELYARVHHGLRNWHK